MKKCTGTIDNKTQKNELNRRYFIVILPKLKRQFFQRPKKKIDKRKSRKVISRNATNQKKHGTHKATARRKEEKKQEIYHR